MTNKERLNLAAISGGPVEEMMSILSSLAIEGIFLPANTLEKMLTEVGLGPGLTENLVRIFGKNGSKNGNEK